MKSAILGNPLTPPLKMHATKMISLCLLVILLTDVLQAHPQPVSYGKWKDYHKATGKKLNDENNQCKNGGWIRDLCETCAKVTKSEVAYPLCCWDEKGVRDWCRDFINYKFGE